MSSSFLRRCRLPFHSAHTGSSTAQVSLAKILTIIVTVPPAPSPPDSLLGLPAARPDANDISTKPPETAVNLDLRLGLGLETSRGSEALIRTPAEEDEEGIPTAHSGVVNCPNQTLSYEASTVDKASKTATSAVESIRSPDTSSDGECSPETAPINHGTREISEITNTSCKLEDHINKEGYLDLLLEAARQVSGECAIDLADENDEKASPPPPSGSGSRKRKSTPPPPPRSKPRKKTSPAPAAFNGFLETAPVVRSRRGRNQVLPLRYRDSILEPWRKPPTVLRR